MTEIYTTGFSKEEIIDTFECSCFEDINRIRVAAKIFKAVGKENLKIYKITIEEVKDETLLDKKS